MNKSTSLFELIKENLDHDELKSGFSLPREQQEGSPGFVDGAMDGILLYHSKPYEAREEELAMLGKALAAASAGDGDTADELFDRIGQKVRALQLVDGFQLYIQQHADELNIAELYPCIFDIVCRSSHRESIKFCLEIMELLDTEHDFIKNVVRMMGLSDEFTLYAVWIMRNWENGNEEIFELAKRVHGWGRIHAVEQLVPDTEEIREWLLTEGVKNEILPAYSALTCWEKSAAQQRLAGELSEAEYRGILTLCAALMDEGPISGISNLENPDALVAGIVKRADEYALTLEDYEKVHEFLVWAETEGKEQPRTAAACRGLLFSEPCRAAVQNAQKTHTPTPLTKLFEHEA